MFPMSISSKPVNGSIPIGTKCAIAFVSLYILSYSLVKGDVSLDLQGMYWFVLSLYLEGLKGLAKDLNFNFNCWTDLQDGEI